MKNNYLVVNNCTDPYYNLALEEYLLTHHMEGVIVMLWQNDNTIVVGRHQNAMEEINQQFVKEHGIRVVRRTTGGGAVYHDLGNLNYSVIADRGEEGRDEMKHFTGPVIEVLRELGAKAEFSGRNDIMIEDRKVSGTAQRIYRNRILHHGCLLFDSDLSVVSKSLNVRSEKFNSKAVKSVKSRVGNIKDYVPDEITMDVFRERLAEKMLEDSGYDMLKLPEKELVQIERLKREKYETWEWNYGQPINCAIHNYKKYEGGTVEVYMNVREGRIEECLMYGDFMALRPASEVAGRLTGCRYRYEEVLEVLQEFRIRDYFGTIEANEVAACICCVPE
ncbi:lipoate--protein ligase [[Clostridium] hylemonae]|uniref:lipoate--protein ligase n=1 Tax=[Clostridium] hylemonae TaxID=89153 RepID=UPI001FCCA766|nr:lipoate--protein ligase [[Clostridium] hylemonae]BDF06014.1 lipoate--protein ligase [[Clostridium] hylemonae]